MVLAAVGGLAAVGFSALAQQTASAEPAIPAGANFSSWADNGKDGQRVLQLVKGDMPAAGAIVSGVVKTDTNCDPDAQGIFHCHNVIALASGGEIEVVHNHMMMNFPCLAPDQKLTLARLNSDWVVAKDAQ
ncbi:MAG: hypothetical protein ABSF67_12920 [Roseiarcus sp.]